MCHLDGIEAFVIRSQLHWSGHVVWIDNHWLPEAVFYGQLTPGSQPAHRLLRRYKDGLKSSLKHCAIDPASWESTALNRSLGRHSCFTGVVQFESNQLTDLETKDNIAKIVFQIHLECRSSFVDIDWETTRNHHLCLYLTASVLKLLCSETLHLWIAVTFEDKRRQNFEKGFAELERRRALLLEQQKRDVEERLAFEKKEEEKLEKAKWVRHCV